MASSLSSINTWILSLKVMLFAFGVVSVAMVMEYIVPLLLDFAVNDLPATWSVLQSYLKPPYLYLLINVIIFTIFATSSFHHRIMNENQSQPLVNPTPSNLQGVPIQQSFGNSDPPVVVYDSSPMVFEDPQPPILNPETASMNDLELVGVENDDEFMISRSSWNPPPQISNFSASLVNTRSEFISPVREKPLVTSRFAHTKQTKTSPDGQRALRVAKPKKHETLENTWKTITDGRRMPLTRHLRKSETFENHRHSDVYPLQQAEAAAAGKEKKVMKKAATLRDRTNYDNQNGRPPSPASGGKMRKEGSLSHDELNRRVEAFIKKFNDEMRLQRQESMNQYREMTQREMTQRGPR